MPLLNPQEVYPMDMVVFRKNQIDYKIKVLAIPESRMGAKLVNIYREDLTPKDAFQHTELLAYSKTYYRKKERADLPKKTDVILMII